MNRTAECENRDEKSHTERDKNVKNCGRRLGESLECLTGGADRPVVTRAKIRLPG